MRDRDPARGRPRRLERDRDRDRARGSAQLGGAASSSPDELAALALAVETEDLGIAAGPQDRLIQAHEGLLYMDFSESADGPLRAARPGRAAAAVRRLAARQRASRRAPCTPTCARRYARATGEPGRRSREIAELAERGRECLRDGRRPRARPRCSTANVDARARLVELDPRHLRHDRARPRARRGGQLRRLGRRDRRHRPGGATIERAARRVRGRGLRALRAPSRPATVFPPDGGLLGGRGDRRAGAEMPGDRAQRCRSAAASAVSR